MDTDLQARIDECITDDDGDQARDILEEQAVEITDNEVIAKLVKIALDADSENVVSIYEHVIGRVDAETTKSLNTALAECDDKDDLFNVMKKDSVVPHHGALLDQLDLKNQDDDFLGDLLAAVGAKFSREHKVRVARAIGVDEFADTEERVTAISKLGALLDDDTIVRIVDKIAED